MTSSVKSGFMVARSSTVKSDSSQPLSSAIFTAAPEMWCVSRNGTPAAHQLMSGLAINAAPCEVQAHMRGRQA